MGKNNNKIEETVDTSNETIENVDTSNEDTLEQVVENEYTSNDATTPETIEVIFVKNPIVINMAYSVGDVVTFPSNKALALIEDGLAKNYDGLPLPVEDKKVSYLTGDKLVG